MMVDIAHFGDYHDDDDDDEDGDDDNDDDDDIRYDDDNDDVEDLTRPVTASPIVPRPVSVASSAISGSTCYVTCSSSVNLLCSSSN